MPLPPGFKFDIASEADVAKRKRETLAEFSVEEDAPSYPPRPQKPADPESVSPPAELPKDLHDYLMIVYYNPDMMATERDKKFHISARKGVQYRKRLMGLGLLEEFRHNPGGQGRVRTFA